MRGHPEVIDALNALLTAELTAIDIYFLQSRIFEDMGYTKLFERFDHEKDDEQAHCALIIERIIYLEGTPNVHAREAFEVDLNVQKMLEMDLELEEQVSANLNRAMALCREHGDNGTRKMLEQLLMDTEMDHILWMKSQVRMIKEIGLDNYLAEQL